MYKTIVAIVSVSILTSSASAVYNPKLGRFAQRDPLGYEDGMNLYEYVKSEPLRHVDPLGLCDNCIKRSEEYIQLLDTEYNQLAQFYLPSAQRAIQQWPSKVQSDLIKGKVLDLSPLAKYIDILNALHRNRYLRQNSCKEKGSAHCRVVARHSTPNENWSPGEIASSGNTIGIFVAIAQYSVPTNWLEAGAQIIGTATDKMKLIEQPDLGGDIRKGFSGTAGLFSHTKLKHWIKIQCATCKCLDGVLQLANWREVNTDRKGWILLNPSGQGTGSWIVDTETYKKRLRDILVNETHKYRMSASYMISNMFGGSR